MVSPYVSNKDFDSHIQSLGKDLFFSCWMEFNNCQAIDVHVYCKTNNNISNNIAEREFLLYVKAIFLFNPNTNSFERSASVSKEKIMSVNP